MRNWNLKIGVLKIEVLKIIWRLKFWKLYENWSFENYLKIEILKIRVLKIEVLKIIWRLEFWKLFENWSFENWNFENYLRIEVLKIIWKLEFWKLELWKLNFDIKSWRIKRMISTCTSGWYIGGWPCMAIQEWGLGCKGGCFVGGKLIQHCWN